MATATSIPFDQTVGQPTEVEVYTDPIDLILHSALYTEERMMMMAMPANGYTCNWDILEPRCAIYIQSFAKNPDTYVLVSRRINTLTDQERLELLERLADRAMTMAGKLEAKLKASWVI